MSKATDKRHAAIKAFSTGFLNADNGYKIANTPENRESVRKALTNLTPLGRTDRWRTAVSNALTDLDDAAYDLQWVIVQHSVYLGYAAE